MCVFTHTWPIGTGLLGVELGPKRSTGLQLGFGELGQVGHDGVLVHVGVDDLFRGDDLSGRDREGRGEKGLFRK